jgi:hypothetical protein
MVLDAEMKQAFPQELKTHKPLALVQLALAEGVDQTVVEKTQMVADTDAEARSGLIALIVAHRTFSAMAREEGAAEGVRQPVEGAAVRSFPLASVLAALHLPSAGGSLSSSQAETGHRWERVHQCLQRWVTSATYLAVVPSRAPGRFEGVKLSFMPSSSQLSEEILPSSVPSAALSVVDWGAAYAPNLAAARAQYPNAATMQEETQALVVERDRLVQSVAQVCSSQPFMCPWCRLTWAYSCSWRSICRAGSMTKPCWRLCCRQAPPHH